MDDLVTWLRAQLDEDERVARAAEADNASPWQIEEPGANIRTADHYTVVHIEDSTPEPATAEHIARWDPARVLAEIDAKRRIIAHIGMVVISPGREALPAEYVEQMELFLRALALPYADRPGYRSEWAA